MSFSDQQLAQRLRNMATDKELSGDSVGAKWLYEAAARIMGLANFVPEWHPAMTSNGSKGQVLEFKVKNPFEGDQSGF